MRMIDALLDDFFWRAMLAGIGVALVAGPFGCLVVWRRMAYFGDTLSHAALLGVALSLALQLQGSLMVFLVSASVALLLQGLGRRSGLAGDAILGILAHGLLAVGLVVLSILSNVRVNIEALLFGDILAVSRHDLLLVWLGGALVLSLLVWQWRVLFAATVNRELAVAEGLPVARADTGFLLMMALVIAIAMKIVGVLLITALLIIPAATARRLAQTPEQMAWMAALYGALAVIGGLFASLRWDTPSGPSIVVAALVLFVLMLGVGRRG